MDAGIKKINEERKFSFKRPMGNDWDIEEIDETKAPPQKTIERLGLVMQHHPTEYPYINFNVIKGEVNEDGTSYVGKVEKLDISKFVIPDEIKEEDKLLLQLVRKLQPAELTKYLNKNSPTPVGQGGVSEDLVNYVKQK